MAVNTMNRVRQLWRIQMPEREPAAAEQARLADGLRLHVAHEELGTILVRAGEVQRSYVTVTGCRGCARGHCEVGCRSDMFRRLLERCVPGVELQLVSGGLAARPYTRFVLATPQKGAAGLNGALLHSWPEARLVVSWRKGPQSQVYAAVLLAVGEQGPAPHDGLDAKGWRAWPLPEVVRQRVMQAPLPAAPRVGQPRALIPSLLLPAPLPQPEEPVAAGMDAQLAAFFRAVMDGAGGGGYMVTIPYQRNTAGSASASPWPGGPNALSPERLGTLVAQLLTEPSFQSERKGQSGLSKGRLVKHAGLSESTARALMVWFDRAGVLAPPEDGQSLWRAPRPFALSDLELIAAKLRGTPLPSHEEIRAAYGGEG